MTALLHSIQLLLLLMQEFSKSLGQVVDIVVSHQGLPLKMLLVSRLMATLVLPAPEHYRPLLRRFAALGSYLPSLAYPSGIPSTSVNSGCLRSCLHCKASGCLDLESWPFRGTQRHNIDHCKLKSNVD